MRDFFRPRAAGFPGLLLLIVRIMVPSEIEPANTRSAFPPLPFEFALAEEDAARFRSAGEDTSRSDSFGTSPRGGPTSNLKWSPARPGERIDLFQERAGRSGWPRWKWVGARNTSDGQASLTGREGAATLAVWRQPGTPGYEIGAPFRWPDAPREIHLTRRAGRTLLGDDATAVALGTPRWITGDAPQDDPLCETDGTRRWQCVSLTPGPGAIVFCGPRGERRSAGVDSSRTGSLSLEATDWAAPIAIEGSPDGSVRESESISFWISAPAGGNGQIRDTAAARAVPIEGRLYWITGPAGPETRLVARSSAARAGSLETSQIEAAPCGLPLAMSLAETGTLRGHVIGTSGNALARASVLLLERREVANRADPGSPLPRALSASTLSDEEGAWSFDGVERNSLVVRACHAAAGCAEKDARPGGEDVEIVLSPRWRFTGRVVSSSGSPLAQAHLRLLPTLDHYAGARDRLLTLPPETDVESDSQGRFEIAAAVPGSYYLEARALRVGTARRPLDVSEFSPALTELGDLSLAGAVELVAVVSGSGCSGGSLALAGPVGATSMPAMRDFPLDSRGAAHVELPEGGSWLMWAHCPDGRRDVEPNVLTHVEDLEGIEVRLTLHERGSPPAEDTPPTQPPR